MSKFDPENVRNALMGAGFEVYRSTDGAIHLAERIRYHLMDSGVLVRLDPGLAIGFAARSQRSDFPNLAGEQLFQKVVDLVGCFAVERGYSEIGREVVDVRDPVDATKILDVWHEVRYEKPLGALDEIIDEVRWALSFEKYVGE